MQQSILVILTTKSKGFVICNTSVVTGEWIRQSYLASEYVSRNWRLNTSVVTGEWRPSHATLGDESVQHTIAVSILINYSVYAISTTVYGEWYFISNQFYTIIDEKKTQFDRHQIWTTPVSLMRIQIRQLSQKNAVSDQIVKSKQNEWFRTSCLLSSAPSILLKSWNLCWRAELLHCIDAALALQESGIMQSTFFRTRAIPSGEVTQSWVMVQLVNCVSVLTK